MDLQLLRHLLDKTWSAFPATADSYLCASFEEKAFEPRAGTHQGLDAVLGDLITPGDVQLL